MPLNDAPLYNKQHAVPQNIMDVEFKIIGELTLRQFAYLIVFGGIAYISAVYMHGFFRWPTAICSALLGFGLAFVPLEERGLDQWIVNFFMAVYTPSQKIWRKDPITPAVFLYQNMAVVKQELITLAPTSSRRKLEEFLELQDYARKEDKLDIPENQYIQMAKEAFGEVRSGVSSETPVVSDSVADTSPRFTPDLQPHTEVQTPHKVTEKPIPEPKPEIKPAQSATPIPSVQPPHPVQPILPKPEPKEEHPPKPNIEVRVSSEQQEKPRKLYQPRPEYRPNPNISSPMTPDRHSGRRFVSLLPKQGEIILPIRGERVLRTSEEVGLEDEMKEKTEQLNKLIKQIRGSHEYRRTNIPPKPSTPAPVPAPKPVKEQVPSKEELERRKLMEEVERLREEVRKSKMIREQQAKAQTQPQAPAPVFVSKSHPEQQTIPMPKPVEEKPKETVPDTVVRPTRSVLITPNTPNTISGLVKEPAGFALPGTVVIIKNDMGKTVRALKTNSLGQFTLVTPLSNGSYTIEIDPFHKTDYLFDIISTEVKGEIMTPFELSGRPANAK